MKLREAYNEWLIQKKRQVKITTINVYRSYWECRIDERWGDADLADINRKTVRPWAYEQMDSGLSKKYVQGMLIMLKMLVKFAGEELDEKIQSTNWGIVWPTKNKDGVRKIETYSAADTHKIINACVENPTSRTIALMIAFCTGMRIGEVCGIKWEDVDIDKKAIHVKRTIIRTQKDGSRETFLYIGSTKTSSGTRDIPLVKNLIPILRKWKSFHGDEKYVASCGDVPAEPNTYRKWSKEFMQSIGIKQILKFHAIRHTFATNLIEAGVDVKSVSTMMGHSDISTTLDLYVHPSEESKAKAVNKVISKLF